MVTPIVRLAKAVEEAERGYAKIDAEELLGDLNRFHQSKALPYTALVEIRGSSCEAPSTKDQCG